MAWKNLASWAFFVTELGLCDISLKSSIQDNHQGYRKHIKLKWVELLKEVFWRPSSATKNAQLVEIYQEIYNPEGSDYFFLLGPICGQTLPRSLSGLRILERED